VGSPLPLANNRSAGLGELDRKFIFEEFTPAPPTERDTTILASGMGGVVIVINPDVSGVGTICHGKSPWARLPLVYQSMGKMQEINF